jgi:hypothetical protein
MHLYIDHLPSVSDSRLELGELSLEALPLSTTHNAQSSSPPYMPRDANARFAAFNCELHHAFNEVKNERSVRPHFRDRNHPLNTLVYSPAIFSPSIYPELCG